MTVVFSAEGDLFQQDNGTLHALFMNGLSKMMGFPWPLNIADLSTTEHLWSELEQCSSGGSTLQPEGLEGSGANVFRGLEGSMPQLVGVF